MISVNFWAGILFGISAFFLGCDRLTPLPKNPPSLLSPVPSRDEIFVFSYGRISMSEFEALRTEFPGVTATDLASMVMSAQWLMNKKGGGEKVSLLETTRCVRALYLPTLSPPKIKAANLFLVERFGIPSLTQLRNDVNDAVAGWHIEWNPSLVLEYKISVLPPRTNSG